MSVLLIAGLLARTVSASTSCNVTAVQALAPTNTTVNSAIEVTTGPVPYCAITASMVSDPVLNDVINYAIDLPDPPYWNGRFLFNGNGQFAGVIGNITKDLSSGWAEGATDTGHQSAEQTDITWALNNAPAVLDYEYRGIHRSASSSEQIITGYYGNSAYHTYFAGCSTAGRQGLIEAQDYPNDFQGIVAGDSPIGQPYLGMNWSSQAILASASSYIDTNAINLINAAVLTQCDGIDGVVDGLIQDPSKCTFQPSSLQCAPGQTTGCLSAGQVTALTQIYQGPVDNNGKSLYPGLSVSDPATSAPADAAWNTYVVGCNTPTCMLPDDSAAEPWANNKRTPVNWTAQDSFFKYLIFDNVSFDSRTLNYSSQSNLDYITNTTAELGGEGENPNIAPFVSLGHKLLMYHGWSDPAFSPYISVNYFNAVQGVLGTGSATTNSVRLFMVPGMHHCQSSGPGPNIFDSLTPIFTWVEQGTAPDGLLATHHVNDIITQPVDRTMPLCSYPEEAVYNGTGQVNQSTSWSCKSN